MESALVRLRSPSVLIASDQPDPRSIQEREVHRPGSYGVLILLLARSSFSLDTCHSWGRRGAQHRTALRTPTSVSLRSASLTWNAMGWLSPLAPARWRPLARKARTSVSWIDPPCSKRCSMNAHRAFYVGSSYPLRRARLTSALAFLQLVNFSASGSHLSGSPTLPTSRTILAR